jgi:hypothetical protein
MQVKSSLCVQVETKGCSIFLQFVNPFPEARKGLFSQSVLHMAYTSANKRTDADQVRNNGENDREGYVQPVMSEEIQQWFDIAKTGLWDGTIIGLEGGANPKGNHAKIGVSNGGTQTYSIFGDMNQQGSLSGNCSSSQNGRGGLFYVLDDPQLFESVRDLIHGETEPSK